MFHCFWYLLWFNHCVARKKTAYCNSHNWALVGTQCSVITGHSYWGAIQRSFPICGKPACISKLLTNYNITLKTSIGVLLVLGLLSLVRLHFIASSGISTSEFPTPTLHVPRGIATLSLKLRTTCQTTSNFNTTVVFTPGYHEGHNEGQLVIQDVLRWFLCEREGWRSRMR